MTTNVLIKTAVTTDQRCDRCGAAARVQARKLFTNLELFFCGHHANENRNKLAKADFILLAVTHTTEA